MTEKLLKVPQHVAIIMDGNGRWARHQSLSRIEGHRRGSEVARDMVTACAELKIPYLTLYAFSSENWRRDPNEITGLMELLQHYLESKAQDLHKEGVRLRVIGEKELLPNNVLRLVDEVETLTKDNRQLTLQMAISYGSRAEITHAAREMARKVRDRLLDPEQIDETTLEGYLYTAGVPDPDVLIRTSGEMRVSNYLLWQLAYTELFFVDKFWPDFTADDLKDVLIQFQERERRFGTAA